MEPTHIPPPILPSSKSQPLLPSSPPKGTPQMPVPAVSLPALHFKEIADYEKGFADYFEEKIKPLLKVLEQERLVKMAEVEKIKPKAQLVLIAGIIIGVGLTIYFKHLGWAVFFIVIAMITKFTMLNGPIAKLRGQYKDKIIPEIVRFFGDFKYLPQQDPPEAELRASGLFDSFNRIYGDDQITGKYKGTDFTFIETHLQRHSGGGRHSSTVTVFKGMLLVMDVKKPFAGQTIIKRESQKGLWSWLTGKTKGLKSVKFPDPEFEKFFEVYTSDENEAKTLLTPDFIARLITLNSAYPNNMIRCCFLEGKLLLAYSYGADEVAGKLFEAGQIEKTLADTQDIHKFLAQMDSILQIIETVNPPEKLKDF